MIDVCVCSCFLMLEAAALTCFVPAGIIIFINILIAFRISCLLREPVHAVPLQRNPCDDPDTEETHDNEIEVLSSGPNQPDYQSVQSDSPAPSSERRVSELDPVYRPCVQLFAVILLLLLFCLIWTSAAFVIVPPFEFAHDTVVYHCSYAVSAVSLGLFFVLYYCLCRSDVQSSCFWRRQSSSCESSRWQYVKATNGNAAHESGKLHENGSAVCDSRGADETSAVLAVESLSTAEKSVHSDGASTKTNGPQFIAPVVAIPECVAFYNPRQNGVARKYWERSRKKRAMANLYHKEAQLHRDGDDSKPDGASGNTTPNGNVKSAVIGVHQKVVTAAVENVPRHVTELSDEQQPLLSLINRRTDDRARTLSCASSDVGTGTADVTAIKCEPLPSYDTAVMAVSSAEQCSQSDKQNCSNSCANDGKTLAVSASDLCVSEESAMQRSSSVDTAEHTSCDSKNMELQSVIDVSCRHMADSQNSSEKDAAAEERSPNTGTARAFINKNYCASIPRTSYTVHKSDCKDSKANDTSASVDVSDTSMADVWVRQHSRPSKLKTETSV